MIKSEARWLEHEGAVFGVELQAVPGEYWHSVGLMPLMRLLKMPCDPRFLSGLATRVVGSNAGDVSDEYANSLIIERALPERPEPGASAPVPMPAGSWTFRWTTLGEDRAMLAAGLLGVVEELNRDFDRNVGVGSIESGRELACAWDDQSFVLSARGPASIERLAALSRGFGENVKPADQVTLWPGWEEEAASVSLCLARVSAVPRDFMAASLAEDQEQSSLCRMLFGSGILDRLYAASMRPTARRRQFKLHHWSLAPIDRAPPFMQTRYKFLVYIVPANPTCGKEGLYSVEELDAWIRGRGPVVSGRRSKKGDK